MESGENQQVEQYLRAFSSPVGQLLEKIVSAQNDPLARTPKPPYYAVVFTSVRTAEEPERYAQMAERMVELASHQLGFLGVESVRDENGVGITVSYWDSREAIAAWGRVAAHREAQRLGMSVWYEHFRLRICRVEEDRVFHSGE
jgi:heme-degrading monooxygenase HmoA